MVEMHVLLPVVGPLIWNPHVAIVQNFLKESLGR